MKRCAPNRSIWFAFVLRVFLILVAVTTLMGLGMIVMVRIGHFGPRDAFPFAWLVLMLTISIVIGTTLSIVVARRILRPITKLSGATERVASGDFSVRIQTDSRVREIRELYDDFDKMVLELSGIKALRDDFVDNVSHEFKTPLASIEGYATLLCDDQLTATLRGEYAHAIIQSARQLSELASNILLISKLENQQIIVDRRAFSLDEQIRQALLLLEPLWSKKNLNLDLELQELAWKGSEELLFQVWQNILTNAIKFSPEGGTIRVEAMDSGGEVRVSIRDEGVGMTREEIRFAFDKFYQSDHARGVEGNGLGLTLVKRILDLSGGTIEIVSQPGAGACFTVALPINI